MLSGRAPVFRQFGGDVYSSDVVQQAIACIADEMSKLDPVHISKTGEDSEPVNDNIQFVLNNPNPTMTTSDFLEKITWQLFLFYNSFIIPAYDGKTLAALYPVQPKEVTFLTNEAGENLYIKMAFENGTDTTLNYKDVIHIRHKYALNDFMGGNKQGNPDLDTLLSTVELNHNLLTGVSNAVKSSFSVNAVVKHNTLMDQDEMEKNLNDLTERLNNNESGFLPMDLKGEFIPIKKDIQLVDDKTLEFLDQKILRHFGVSLPILSGNYSKEQKEAFYEKTLEPLIIKLTQAFTKVLFTDRERSLGHKIDFFSKEIIFMTMEQKLEMIRLLGDSGSLFENEKRTIFGLRPLPELKGVRLQSLNYINVNIADSYQMKQKDENIGGSNEEGIN